MDLLFKKHGRSALVFLLILALIMTPFTNVVGETTPTVNSKYIGQYVDVDGNGDKISGTATDNAIKRVTSSGGTYLEHSKTIEPTTTKNKYRITLNVETNSIRTAVSDTAIVPHDVVIMLDVSNSMAGDRYKKSRDSMITFINNFLKPGGSGYVKGNRVAIGSFSGKKSTLFPLYSDSKNNDAKTDVCGWTDSADFATGKLKDTVITQNSASSNIRDTNQGGGTNMQAGFEAADTIFSNAAKSTNDQILIYVGDGLATFRYDGKGYTVGDGDNKTSDKENDDAAINAMKKLKGKYSGKSLKIFTLGIGHDANNNNVLTYNLPNTDGVERFFQADDNIDIPAAFKEILGYISLGVEPWLVTDPMSKWVDFAGFDTSTFTYANEAIPSGGGIEWALTGKNATPTTGTNGEIKYTYTISYYVTLDTKVEGFSWEEFYPTNKITEVNYRFITEKNGKIVKSNPGKSEFRIPTVMAEKELGSIKVTKTGTNNVKLDGGEFALMQGPTEVATAEAIKGEILFEDIEWGTYKVVEKIAPKGYDKDSFNISKDEFVIYGNDVHLTATATNNELGSITLDKIDNKSGDQLSGGEFSLWKDGSKVATVAAISGKIEFKDLKWGTYRVKEDVAPKGYDRYSFSFNKDIEITSGSINVSGEGYTATNKKLNGWVVVEKYDYVDGTPLSGGLFALLDDNQNEVATSTAVDGYIDFKDIPWGTYTVKELEAPVGYDKDTFDMYPKSVVINENLEVFADKSEDEFLRVTAQATNKKLGSISVRKFDSVTSNPISGGTFGLIKDGDIYATTTAVSGDINFKDLPWGEYEFVEIEAPTGYGKDSLVITDAKGNPTSSKVVIGVNDGVGQIDVKLMAFNTPVLPDIVIPDGNVLPAFEEAEDDDGSVLGEEAKTSDSVNPMLTMFMLLAALAVITGIAARRRQEMDK